MISLAWSDPSDQYFSTVIGDRDSILRLYGFLLRHGCKRIHTYSCESGVELDPETGFRTLISQREK